MKKAMRNMWWAALALAAAVASTGCTPLGSDWESNASISISKSALRASSIARIQVSVSGPGIATPMQSALSQINSQWLGDIKRIPAGSDRRFVAVAYDENDNALFEGMAEGVELLAGKTAGVMITLQQKMPPNPFHNTVPTIDALTASMLTVAPSNPVSLNVAAHDDDSDNSLSYAWTASGGSFNRTNAPKVEWTAPQTAGPNRLTITVSDNHGATIVVTMTINVKSNDFADSKVEASFNTWPRVQSVFADPGRANRGEPISLRVIAADLDGDSLSYKWKVEGTGCEGGTFTDNQSNSPVWMSPSTLPSSGRCALTVEVNDGKGGTTKGTMVVQLGDSIQVQEASSNDNTAPTSSLNYPSGTPVPFFLNVTIACTDQGSGCNRIVYTLDGSKPTFDPPNGTIVHGDTAQIELFSTDPFTVFDLRYASEDKAGNRENPQQATYRIQ